MRFAVVLSLLTASAWAQEGTGPYPQSWNRTPAFRRTPSTVHRTSQKSKGATDYYLGNGGCANNGLSHRNFLMEIASYAFLTIAIGRRKPLPRLGKASKRKAGTVNLDLVGTTVAEWKGSNPRGYLRPG